MSSPSPVGRVFGWILRALPLLSLLPSNRGRDGYRARDRFARDAETRYADPLGEVVDHMANDYRRPAEQLAEDLSGRYGPFAVRWQSVPRHGRVVLEGEIFNDRVARVGRSVRTFYRDRQGYLIVSNDYLKLEEAARGQGFATELYDELERYYRRSGVDVITIHAALENGGYTWARRGFDWDPAELGGSFANVRRHIDQLISDPQTHPNDQELLSQMRDRLDEDDPGEEWPTPNELAQLRGEDPQLGRKLMVGTNWYGILPLSEKGLHYGT